MALRKKISFKKNQETFETFIQVFQPSSNSKILDAGVSSNSFRGIRNYFEEYYVYTNQITALGVENLSQFSMRFPQVAAVQYAGGIFPLRDKAFDICWCNAVLEHVGNWKKQKYFLQEILRVSKKAYIVTPNRYCPFELHTKLPFLHYLPKRIFDRILDFLGMSWATGDFMHLLSLREIKGLLSACGVEEFGLMRSKLFGFTVRYIIILGDNLLNIPFLIKRIKIG